MKDLVKKIYVKATTIVAFLLKWQSRAGNTKCFINIARKSKIRLTFNVINSKIFLANKLIPQFEYYECPGNRSFLKQEEIQ